MTNRRDAFFQHEAKIAREPADPGIERKIMAYGHDLPVVACVPAISLWLPSVFH